MKHSWEEKITFSPDGKAVFFGRHPDGDGGYDKPQILTRRYENGRWSEAIVASFSAGKRVGWPILSPDGKTLFAEELGGKIVYTKKTNRGWAELEELRPDVAARQGFGLAQLSNHNTFYFYDRFERLVYSAKYDDGNLANIKPLPYQINPAAEYFVSRNDDYIIFTPIGWHNPFHISFKKSDESWTLPLPLSDYFRQKGAWTGRGMGPYVSPDEKYFFFGMRGDIYWVKADFIEALKDIAFNRRQ